jgi:predicted DNA-binding ribbon-helix-helix protein
VRTRIVNRLVVIARRPTIVSLEAGFWDALEEIADYRNVVLSDLLAIIDADRHDTDLASAIRVFVLGFYRDQIATGKGQSRIGTPTALTAV